MKAIDRAMLDRYVAAYKRRGFRARMAFARGKEAFRLAQSAFAALELGTQRAKDPEWRRRKALAHKRVISRIGELGK